MENSPYVVIEWSAWECFLIASIVPNIKRISTEPGAQLSELKESLLQARVILLHVNATCQGNFFPDRELFKQWAQKKGIVILNGEVETIEKWTLQRNCQRAGLPSARAPLEGNPDEILVVKARANHGGLSERRLPDKYLGDIARLERWPFKDRIELAARSKIAPDVWTHSGLTVERYINNSAGRFHRAYVMGDYVGAATSFSTSTMKEMDHRKKQRFRSTFDGPDLAPSNTDVLSVAYRCARSMHANFAAIDVAEDESGTLYPIDLNVTPWWGDDQNEQLTGELKQELERLKDCATALLK